MKFSNLDNLLIGIFSLIFISSIYFLIPKSGQSAGVKQVNDIGSIVEITNSVKKRHISMMTWHNAFESDAIQEDDIIFTNDKSSVVLKFNDGSLLTLENDSLIRLKDLKDSYGIFLEKGDFQINTQKKMNIELLPKNGQNITINDSGIFKLSKHNNTIEINSIKGNGSLTSLNGNTEIESGQNVNIINNKTLKHSSSIVISEGHIENDSIHLEWTSDKDLSHFTIQVAEDFSFTKTHEIKAHNSPAEIPWNKPVAYVKIFAINKSQNITLSVSRKIYSVKPKSHLNQSREQPLISKIISLFNTMWENTQKYFVGVKNEKNK